MLVRAAKTQDSDAVYSMLCEFNNCNIDKELFGRLFEKAISEKHRCILVADENGELIGYADAQVKLELSSCSFKAFVEDIYVAEQHRSCGVGTAMIISICNKMRSEGCLQIQIQCSRVNMRSQSFLERHSFIKSKHLYTFSTKR